MLPLKVSSLKNHQNNKTSHQIKSSEVLCTLPSDPFPYHCLAFPLFLVNIVYLGETDGAAVVGVERHRQLVVVPQRVRGALRLRHVG